MKNNAYMVSDSESCNYVLYNGNPLVEAKEIILNSIEDDKKGDGEIIELDLYCNENRIWSGKANTESELRLLICNKIHTNLSTL